MKTKPTSKRAKRPAATKITLEVDAPAPMSEATDLMLFKVVDAKPVAYINSADERPDGKVLLTIPATVDRFGHDSAFWANHWQSLLGRYVAPESEAVRSKPIDLKVGQVIYDESRGAAMVVTFVDGSAFVGLAIGGTGPTLGKRYGCDLSDVSQVCPLTIFEIADSLRPRVAAARSKAGAK